MGSAASGQSQELQDRISAEQLFKQAVDGMGRHDYAAACPKLEEVVRLLPGKIGAMHRLASCYEQWGRLASAWAQYKIVAATAPVTDELKKASADKVQALEPRLARLAIVLSGPGRATSGLEVRRDGAVVPAGVLGDAIPVDAGPHTVTVTAPMKKPWTGSAEVGAGARVSIEVPPLEAQEVAAPPAVAPTLDGPPAAAPNKGDAKPSGGSGQKTFGGVLMGLGGAGVLAGGIFTGLAYSKYSSLKTTCPSQTNCPSSMASDVSTYHTMGGVGLGAFIGGGALIGAGLAVYLTSPKGPSDAKVHVSPRLALGYVGFEGDF